MESTWYLFHGQTLENTKISDRAHALHITKEEWSKITKHLDRKKLIQEAIDKEEAVKRYLDEGSKSMTKSWENSLENVRRRKEEERVRLIQQSLEERANKFVTLREEQEAARKKFVDKVEHDSFMMSGSAKSLTSALITTEILHEREVQKAFSEKLKQHEKEEQARYDELAKQRGIEEIRQDEEKRCKQIEKERKFAETLRQMIDEKLAEEKRVRAERIKKEAVENVLAVKEEEEIKALEEAEKRRLKRVSFLEKQQSLKEEKERERQRKEEERELEEVIDTYKNAKERIDCLQKIKLKEMKDEAVRRRDAIAKLVMAEADTRAEKEEEFLRKAQEEMIAAEEAKIQERKEKDAKNVQERLEDRRQFLLREEILKKKDEELKKWALLNRFKAQEYMTNHEEKKKVVQWQKVLEYRKELMDQMEDNKRVIEREKALSEAFEKGNLERTDKLFYDYAAEVMELATKKGRNTLPIEKAIRDYTKETKVKMEAEPRYCEERKTDLASSITVKKIVTDRKERSKRPCRCYMKNK